MSLKPIPLKPFRLKCVRVGLLVSSAVMLGPFLGGFLGSSGLARAQAEENHDKDSQETLETFSLPVGPMIDAFNSEQIVSDPQSIRSSFYQMDSTPRVVVPSGCEAFLMQPEQLANDYRNYSIVGRKPRGKPISGSLYLIQRHPDDTQKRVLAKLDFKVAEAPKSAADKDDFIRAKGLHYQFHWSEEMAGSAMFRHLAMKHLGSVGETAVKRGPRWPLRPNSGVDGTIGLMSGGRAVSENLQLDQQLKIPESDSAKNLIPIKEVQGISVRPIDWKPMLRDEPTELDPLSKHIPHDQYSVFLPSFSALDELVRRGGEIAKPAVHWFEPQSRKTDVLGFYQHQLGLPLNGLTRQVGKVLIGEVALTGSDPYFRTGTDLAVLMQSGQPDVLYQSILAQVAGSAASHPGNVKQTQHEIDSVNVTEWASADRSFNSCVAQIPDAVIVSNSLHQIRQILRASRGRLDSVHELDEYRFFRQRYPRGDRAESAFVVITDAAIRRWCGPEWRIAASRRTRARATLAEVTMRYADPLVEQAMDSKVRVKLQGNFPDAGRLWVDNSGVRSARYGTLAFQRPIAEMGIRKITAEEKTLYESWRTRYERRWRRNFDPIAFQLSIRDGSIHGDLSVIPLMVQTDYRQFLSLVGSKRLKPGTGDPHPEAVAETQIAIDTQSETMGFARMVLAAGQAGEMNLLSWIDDSIYLYFDEDDIWMQKFRDRSPWDLSPDDLVQELPVGVYLPSKNNFMMASFVVAVRAAIRQFAPNLFQWETVKYGNFEYAVGRVVNSNPLGKPDQLPELCYVTTSKGLTLSFNRRVIERAIDRHSKSPTPAESQEQQSTQIAENPAHARAPAFDPQVTLALTGRGATLMSNSSSQSGLRRMNRIAWSNIPILNYLRKRYPGRNPEQVYQRLFGETLVEPTGGTYEWTEELQTYVSSLHGYHLAPQAGPSISPAFKPNDRIRSAILFQEGGLRATFDLESQGKSNNGDH